MEVALFRSEFQLGNKERIAASQQAMLVSMVRTMSSVLPTSTTALAAAAITPIPAAPPPAARHVSAEGGKTFYCWTHGLSPHRNHTSITCLHKAAGHQDDATAFRMNGGNNTISFGHPRQLPANNN